MLPLQTLSIRNALEYAISTFKKN